MKKNNCPRLLSGALSLLLDILLFVLSFGLAIMIRFEGGMNVYQKAAAVHGLPFVAAIYAACFFAGGVYRMLWRYAGVHELVRLAAVCAMGGSMSIALNSLLDMGMSRNVLVITAVFVLALCGGYRLLWHAIFRRRTQKGKVMADSRRVLILGAGAAGAYALSVCSSSPSRFGVPVAFLDDDPGKLRMRVHGVPVLGRIEEVGRIAEEKKIDSIIVAMPTLKGEAMRKVVEMASATKKSVYMFSSPEAIDGKQKAGAIRELDVSDFLSREEVTLDDAGIRSYIQGKTVLVTGGGGSIGSEICRQLVRFDPAKLLIFDIYENTAYELLYDLRLTYGEKLCPVEILVGSIRDKNRLDEVFETHRPQVVFHAAAHKHVPLMEVSPAEAVKNNVFGTYNVLSCAAEHKVERYVQLSTDKAVNPTNVMGATKRITEMLVQMFARSTGMKCMAVRFGNVLGSHGSVIPLWEQQIRKGGPVTVVDPQITRYFMTIPEAAQLVLQAGALAYPGAIYVLDMGTPCRMMDVAEKLIRFYGYEPNVDMPIRITGLRPGEKMYEELMMGDERDKMTRTAHNKIFVAPPISMDDTRFRTQLERLSAASAHNDEQVVLSLEEIVPTYSPNRKKAAI
ncbi:MAG: polysaccharide biosynthesis protein [Clostridia bacterium]|nr:polysaccharide biosynthesis protein [Clostridia bacterium]MBQ4086010.1 polysaccharide biosynthesis protein [Clostridia bacterium]